MQLKDLIDMDMGSLADWLVKNHDNYELFAKVVKEEPELIQGYTADQWQEIIDGGYLCEGSVDGEMWDYMLIDKVPQDQGAPYYRPAQIKGVMRPIFVEPVDKTAWCAFLSTDEEGGNEKGLCAVYQWSEVLIAESTYAYIEL